MLSSLNTSARELGVTFFLGLCLLATSVPILGLSVVASPAHAQSAATKKYHQQVENLRIWHSPDRTRIVFDVSKDVRHTMFTLSNPHRLVVDIENADIQVRLPDIESDNPHLRAVRSGRPNQKMLRFVFELKTPLEANDFVLSPNELYGHRLVVDLNELAKKSDASAQASAEPLEGSSSQVGSSPSINTVNTSQPIAQPQSSQKVIDPVVEPAKLLVAIDAGHGGEDPGALGHRGSREKKITLAIAKALLQRINQDPNMSAFLVREGDYYIKLHRRREIARERNADMFISIHADAFKRQSANGFSVFALSQSGATSAMARALAAKENASDLIGGVSLADKDEVLAKVLVDLSMNNTISESVNFGGRVLKELNKLGRLHSKRVEQANFAVLKSADIPSVLIETGFITNPNEERNLRKSEYQQKVAGAIYSAISQYYQQTPYRTLAKYRNVKPPETAGNVGQATVYQSLVKPKSPTKHKESPTTHNKTPTTHKVVRGDSLSKIAAKYGTSVATLKKINNLRSNTAVLGQRLKLPSSRSTDRSVASSSNRRPSTYIVRSGDSLSKISSRFNVTISSLKRLNSLSSNRVYVGQKLKLPGGVAIASKPQFHKVQRGDTLSEIADKYGVSQRSIMNLNKLRSRTVMLGQRLKIPSS